MVALGDADARLAALEARIEELSAQCSWGRELEATAADGANLDTIWLIVGAIGVFSMQSGFAMLEVGTCASDHTKEILLKNIVDIAIGTISWWALGYALATGADAFSDTGRNGVVGTSGFFYLGNRDTTYDGKLADQASWFLPTRPALVPPDLPDARAPDASSSSAPARDDLDPLDDEAPLDAAAPSSSSPRAELSLWLRLRDVDDRTWPADGAAGKRTALP